jgi:hypothetical protein
VARNGGEAVLVRSSRAVIEWTPGLRRSLLGLAIAFAALVALRVHGFSLAFWHALLGDSPPHEVLLGEPRRARWDDWVVQLPMILAQRSHDPPFPLVNRNIGVGQNMWVPIATPVWDPLALFHPTLWGFFAGPDAGLAWMWWTQALGVFTAWLLVFVVLSRNRLGLSAAASLLLCFAPLMQFFSLNAAPFAIWMGASWLAGVGIATASTRRGIAACGLGLGWSGACFALSLYPPYQVVLAQLFTVLLAGFLLQRRRELDLRLHAVARVLAVALAIAVVAAAATGLYAETKDALRALGNTEYPGRRIAAGGDFPLWKLLNANFWVPARVTHFGPLGPYISSSASFWIVWPPLAISHAWRALTRREAWDPLRLALALYCAVLTVWCEWGLPAWLAQATGLSLVPPVRAVLGLGFADTTLLVASVALPPPAGNAELGLDAALALAWSAALALAARSLHAAVPEASFDWLVLMVAANGLAVLGLLRRWRPGAVVALLAAGTALGTAWFNPLAMGGSAYLFENPVSRAIRAVDRQSGGHTVWVSYGDPKVANLFRVLGIRALNGVEPVPQLELWRRVDPEGKERSDYNRFGHVLMELSRADGRRFSSTIDSIEFHVDPAEALLPSLGVTHLLVRTSTPELLAYFARYRPLERVGPYSIFELPLRPRSGE